ncbi:hypothetical protein PINS_up000747 [Pythium insidiosum]|nr:hypothetical protein PINS_up000747 [Pythium insidiosum]
MTTVDEYGVDDSSGPSKKRRLMEPSGEITPAEASTSRLNFFISGPQTVTSVDSEDDDEVIEQIEQVDESAPSGDLDNGVSLASSNVAAQETLINRVSARKVWIAGEWFGRCDVTFHSVYIDLTLWKNSSQQDESEQLVWKGTMQYRQLLRFSLSDQKSPYFAIIELDRAQKFPPTFGDFYDWVFAKSTQESNRPPQLELFGAALYFDDDLDLVRCKSMAELSEVLHSLLQTPLKGDEDVVVRELYSQSQSATARTLNTSQPTTNASRQMPGQADTSSDGSSSSGGLSGPLRRMSLRRSSASGSKAADEVEVVVQLNNDVTDLTTSNTPQRRTTRGVMKLIQEHEKKEAEKLEVARRSKLLLSYPFDESDSQVGRITIVSGDIDRLAPGEFLNDNIIDFYLRYLWRHLEGWQQKHVYFFSSHFFTQLRGGKLNDSTSSIEDRFARVSRWTQKEDLFSKRFLFIPINDSCHWSIAVICNPNSAIIRKKSVPSKQRSDEVDFLRETIVIDAAPETVEEELEWSQVQRKNYPPCVLFLDSLRCHQKKKICELLRSYLECEYKSRFIDRSTNNDAGVTTTFDANSLELVEPAIPLQSNSSDCGVFLLMYTTEILRRCPAGVTNEDVAVSLASSMSKDMFGDEHVQEFRDYLNQLIFLLQRLARRGASEMTLRDEGLEFFNVTN